MVMVRVVTFLKSARSSWPITTHWSSKPIRAHCECSWQTGKRGDEHSSM